jgi:hypothetical protein
MRFARLSALILAAAPTLALAKGPPLLPPLPPPLPALDLPADRPVIAAQIAGRDVLLTVDFGADPVVLTPVIESGVNLMVLMFAGMWFLLTLEERLRRQRIQTWLHQLRAFAHVVDMHQLTKDPTVILNQGPRTPSSPARTMSRFGLARYLEYCAEMLALTGKLSALMAGETEDHVVIAAAGDVETLCTDLGRKVWQKIMILGELDEKS